MKRKHLESFLQQLDTFDRPKLELEQYATSPELAAAILAEIKNDLRNQEGTLLGDLGKYLRFFYVWLIFYYANILLLAILNEIFKFKNSQVADVAF